MSSPWSGNECAHLSAEFATSSGGNGQGDSDGEVYHSNGEKVGGYAVRQSGVWTLSAPSVKEIKFVLGRARVQPHHTPQCGRGRGDSQHECWGEC